MSFSEQLNEYIEKFNCTAKELSNESGLSATVISRYRNGQRIPDYDSDQMKQLVNALSRIAKQKGFSELNESVIFESFQEQQDVVDYEQIITNLNSLMSVLDINANELARALNFDASYLSRIRSGQRKPANVESFVHHISSYVVKKYTSHDDKKVIGKLINQDIDVLENRNLFISLLEQWFFDKNVETHNQMNDFLQRLDDFDLNEYIKAIHFDELKVPHVPFQLPTSKNYYGVEEMKQGELDFFKSTVLSKSQEPIFMCSDMPLADMAEDLDFSKKWMFAIAMSLKKGLHLNIIHNIDRPFEEMMLGLESWIPIYMTGQVSPYYLKGKHNQVYCHLQYVSGQYALSGECIDGYHHDGKYYLTNNKEEVKYYQKKADHLLSKAQPLMEIFRKENTVAYHAFVDNDALTDGKRHYIHSSLPIYTISQDLLIRILERYHIDDQSKQEIMNYVVHQKEITEKILKNNIILDEINEMSKEEFNEHPIVLSLSGTFYEEEIVYTYEDYLEHLQQTKEFNNKYNHYHLTINKEQVFRNIQISIHEGKWAMISKNKTPVIHFVIRHSKMLYAIENFVVPVSENN